MEQTDDLSEYRDDINELLANGIHPDNLSGACIIRVDLIELEEDFDEVYYD